MVINDMERLVLQGRRARDKEAAKRSGKGTFGNVPPEPKRKWTAAVPSAAFIDSLQPAPRQPAGLSHQSIDEYTKYNASRNLPSSCLMVWRYLFAPVERK